MASNLEFVPFKDFVESLPARTVAKSGDKSIVSNSTDGPGSETNAVQAQKVLAENVAREFDPTRTSGNKYKAGESVIYNGIVKTFKVDHYGAWSDSDVYPEDADLANLVVPNLREFNKVLTYQKAAGGSVNFNPFYAPTSHDSNVFRLEKVEYSGVSTYDIYADDSASALSRVLLKSNVPFGVNVEIELPEGYDRFLFFKNSYVTTGILVYIYNVNKNSLPYKMGDVSENMATLNESVVDVEKEFVAKESVFHYTKSAVAGQNLSFSYSPSASGKFVLEKTAYGDVETYDIYKRDSSGVHSQSIYKSNVLFGEVVELALPEGYDNFLFYKGTTVSTGIDLTLYKANTDTLAWAVERLAGLDGEFVARTKERNFVKGAGNDDRLSFYWTPVESEEKVVVEKTEYVGVNTYDIYLSDSTNTNPLKVFRPNVRFGEIVPVKLSAGYDRFLFYKQEKTTNKIDVTLYRVLQRTLSGQVSLVGGDVDKLYPLKGRKLVCFGDSITQFSQDGWRYSDWFKDASKADVVNVGIGGTRYSLRTDVVETPTTSNQAWAAIDIYNLVRSWCENDFAAVDNAVQWLYENESRSYGWIVDNLKNTPIASAEYVTLFAGTNDYSGGADLGVINNGDQKTVLGALSSIVEELLTANPKLHIFIFSPIIRWFGSNRQPENFSDVYVRNVGSEITLKTFAAAICEAGKNLHIPTCDLYNSLGWTMWNYGEYFPVGDDTHPQYGFKNIGLRFNSFITSHLSS